MRKIIIIVSALLALIIGGTLFFFLSQNREQEELTFDLDPGEPFVTDVCHSRRLLKTDIIIKARDNGQRKYYEQNMHKVRNEINLVLRDKTEDELTSGNGQNKVAEDIIKALNRSFESEDFLEVSFNEFVMQ